MHRTAKRSAGGQFGDRPTIVLATLIGVVWRATLVGATVDPPPIELRRGAVDSRAGASAPAARSAGKSGRRLQLVQLAAPPTDADIAALTATGLQIVQYVPRNAYLVWTPGGDVSRQAQQRVGKGPAGLAYVGDFAPRDALAPALDAAVASDAAATVTVQLFAGADSADADLATVRRLADTVVRDPWRVLNGRFINVRVRARGHAIDAMTQLASVINVEPYIAPEAFDERQGQIVAGNLDPSLQSPSGPGYLGWLMAHGFSTQSADYPITVVVDDGVDDGTTTPLNSEFYELDSIANPSRLAFAVLPPGSSGSAPDGPDGHGNINASIVGGYNDSAGAAVEDAFGFHYGLGISPFGRLANVRVFVPFFDVGFGDDQMVADYFGRGARISSNSWGQRYSSGVYNSQAQEYDALARDAQAALSGNQEILFVFAAGNDGPGTGSVSSPGTAKNVLTVGASETSNPDSASGDGCGLGASNGDDARDMAYFSGRGPCQDGRIKPDIVAPGTFIQGAASQPVFNGASVCGGPANDHHAPGDDAYFPSGTAYTWSSGTSHSTPAVAGYVSLIDEFLGRVYGINAPSPALQKAYVIHSGRHLTGNGANESLPGKNQGFGLANAGFAFDTSAPRFLRDQDIVFSDSGEAVTFTGTVADAGQPIRVALVWTDAPGSTFAAAYVNDLDLDVEVGGNTYLGNNFALGISQPGGVADARNNAESVALPAGIGGAMRISVRAAAIAGDGVPGNAEATDQDFALVAYNFVPSATSSVAFDHHTYRCTDTPRVSVYDADVAGSGSLNLGVTASTGDAETVNATESEPGSGLFVATLALSSAPVSSGDGALQVTDGASLTATYNDADAGSGPAAVQSTATVDCAPPVISAVTSTGVSGSTATITFATNEDASRQVRYGTSCGSLTQVQTVPGTGTSHTVMLTGLSPLTQYYFVVDATDAVGNVSTDDNGGACYSFTTVARVDPFTELFTAGDNDLQYRSVTFTPDDSPAFYKACSGPAASFPTDPTGGTPLAAGDDTSTPVTLSGGAQVALYGTSYSTFYVGSNGYVTFGGGDTTYFESLSAHFLLPRVSALFDDLNPNVSGSVSWKQLADRVAVTYEDVPEFFNDGANSFQIELFFDGRIRITYLRLDAVDGLAGLSRGFGVPGDFVESDLSAYGPCRAGGVSLSHGVYGCADSVAVTVADVDLIGTGTLSVAVTTDGGDAETPVLFETPSGSGTFVGMLATSPAPIATGDGTLEVSNGDYITATYADADDGSGSPATVQATATVDCAPPVISNVAVGSVTESDAIIAFDTNDPTTARIRYGTACASLTRSAPDSNLRTSHAIDLGGLAAGFHYFFAVDATDAAGNLSTDDNGGACYSFTTAYTPEYFTEQFTGGGTDLANTTLTFTPNESLNFYTACARPAGEFPTNPQGGTALALYDDDFATISLTGGVHVSLYGTAYDTLYVGSNGYITFTEGDTTYQESVARHFALPRISALFNDLTPGLGGRVSWKQLADRVAVTYESVADFGRFDTNSFQVEVFFDGAIRITYLGLGTPQAVVGLSAGAGVPLDFVASDLSTAAGCLCGDGFADPGEQCDDGGVSAGDGCGSLCEVEECYSCAGQPSQCAPAAAGSACDDRDVSTVNDVCDAATHCAGRLASLGRYGLLRWQSTPAAVTVGMNSAVAGDLCADTFAARSGASIAGDVVALGAAGIVGRFGRGNAVGQDLISGGGTLRWFRPVQVGGRVDLGGQAGEMDDCAAARVSVAQHVDEYWALAPTSVEFVQVPRGGTQLIQLGSGDQVIDVRTEVSLPPRARLVLVGQPTTGRVIVRMPFGTLQLGYRAGIELSGLRPAQVLFLVNGVVTRQRAHLGGSILSVGTSPVTFGLRSQIDGQVFTASDATLRQRVDIGRRPFEAW